MILYDSNFKVEFTIKKIHLATTLAVISIKKYPTISCITLKRQYI
jgi:hypothetical protein